MRKPNPVCKVRNCECVACQAIYAQQRAQFIASPLAQANRAYNRRAVLRAQHSQGKRP